MTRSSSFAESKAATEPWIEAKESVAQKLLGFFRVFSEKLGELSQSTTCTCNACTHIDKLRLKVVAHSGEALFHRIYNFVELAGVDVIVVHRLLKNTVDAAQYLLLTEAAQDDLELAGKVPLTRGSEWYDEIGRVNTLIYLPEGMAAPEPGESKRRLRTDCAPHPSYCDGSGSLRLPPNSRSSTPRPRQARWGDLLSKFSQSC